MADPSLITVGGIVGSEWRSYLRSPICLIGLLAVVGFMFSESKSTVGWPSANTSLYGFQMASSVLVGIIAFLLASGSLARDLDPGRNQLLFSRPVSIRVYLAGKLAAAISFGLFLVGILLLLSLVRPVLHGVWIAYPAGPFLTVAALCSVPLVVYSCSLAMLFTAVSGRVIIALPAFLLYFLCGAVLRLGGGGDVDFLDFSMRLHEKHVAVDVPIHLSDTSFSHLLDPVQPGLMLRGLLYLAASVGLAAGAAWVINCRRDSRWRRSITRSVWRRPS